MKKIIIIFVVSLFTLNSVAQTSLKEAEAKYLLSFAKLINWNKTYKNKIVINILGETVVTDYLT